MSIRHAACEPCRRAKLACGHERPTCARCRGRDQIDLCVYRARPFRRKSHSDRIRERSARQSVRVEALTTPPLDTSPISEVLGASSAGPRRYPNPGYLGDVSHATIFNQHDESVQPPIPSPPADTFIDQATFDRANHALSLLDQLQVSGLASLIRFWLKKGVSLALGEPFVETARVLLENTHRPIRVHRHSTPSEYLSQMSGRNIRWESLGIFLAAASRAALDTSSFGPLYNSDEGRRGLIKALTYIGDCCLETCLALDCLNDLQLVLQYENLIVHSQVDGDQSYHSWRRMGDVASSLFALGYHEKIDEDSYNIPLFVAELRRSCFARIYAADKSLAIFLGRPPRIMKEFCYFQLPTKFVSVWEEPDNMEKSGGSPISSPMITGRERDVEEHNSEQVLNYTSDTFCSALFAVIKEEVLQLFRKRQASGETAIIKLRHSELRLKIDQQWQDLPPHYRLTTSLKDCPLGPFARDFLAGARLEYLHTHFLLGFLSQRKVAEPDEALLRTSSEMLSIVVETIILRDRMANSGTCLIWKVAQYGLPAAGIISLALLNSTAPDSRQFSRSKMIQALSVLVAEITIGAWIQPGEPNFALFSQATRTIQSLLDSLTALKAASGASDSQQLLNSDVADNWDPYINSQSWELEMDFWASLAEHPTLVN
ncbi:fungal specific transcription factor domain-containing protein [Trichoderma breve]|uniref:Fungal specific transcription factor domain-containing protein n=1 Tax=Trichoderma breve TaxID=2034170 RepID=A0A9W9EEH2_9HYPO|nr:fungal specific transcription factor domain-containing protein [Trichoderma breve]KAJ4865317.1 fungal specific transcription factor domain-containing protein [Trichoderma breve]